MVDGLTINANDVVFFVYIVSVCRSDFLLLFKWGFFVDIILFESKKFFKYYFDVFFFKFNLLLISIGDLCVRNVYSWLIEWFEFDDDRLDSDDELLLSICRYCCFDRLCLSFESRLFFFNNISFLSDRREFDVDKPWRLADGGDGDGRIDDDIGRFRSLLFIVEFFDVIVAADDDII